MPGAQVATSTSYQPRWPPDTHRTTARRGYHATTRSIDQTMQNVSLGTNEVLVTSSGHHKNYSSPPGGSEQNYTLTSSSEGWSYSRPPSGLNLNSRHSSVDSQHYSGTSGVNSRNFYKEEVVTAGGDHTNYYHQTVLPPGGQTSIYYKHETTPPSGKATNSVIDPQATGGTFFQLEGIRKSPDGARNSNILPTNHTAEPPSKGNSGSQREDSRFSHEMRQKSEFVVRNFSQPGFEDTRTKRMMKDRSWSTSAASSRTRAPHGGWEPNYRDNMRTSGSEGEKSPILEENLRRLHEINSGIHKLRSLNNQAEPNTDQNARAENLQRFSTSCPSLADQLLKVATSNPAAPRTQDTHDHYKSMVDLGVGPGERGGGGGRGSVDASSMAGANTLGGNLQYPSYGGSQNVQICINDVTVDDDFLSTGGVSVAEGGSGSDDPELHMIEELKRQHRRSSWCPEENKSKGDRQEKQRMMLAVSGRSQSLSSLDGNDSDSDSDSNDSENSSYKSQDATTTRSLDGRDLDDDLDDDDDLDTSYHGDEECDSPEHQATSHYQQYLDPTSVPPPVTSGKQTKHPTTPVRPLSDPQLATATTKTVSPAASPGAPVAVATSSSTLAPSSQHLQKSVSTPSINTRHGHQQQVKSNGNSHLTSSSTDAPDLLNHGASLPVSPASSTATAAPPPSQDMMIQRLLAEHDAAVARQSCASEDSHTEVAVAAADDLHRFLDNDAATRHRLSMIEFLNETKSFSDDEKKKKEEKKARRSSVFSKLGSYRQKKVAKDNKLHRNTHEFVSVSFSNSTACDVCQKSMANKAALQCENCLVNVHESGCKDQIAPCVRGSVKPAGAGGTAPGNGGRIHRYQSASLPEGPGSGGGGSTSLKQSQSFKECKRAASVPTARPALQVSQSAGVLPRSASPSKVISEEREKEGGRESGEGTPTRCHTPSSMTNLLAGADSPIVDTLSVSTESLDDSLVDPAGVVDLCDPDDDPELSLTPAGGAPEPEAWSVTVDKKTLRKMAAKDIKRQDHIWELIQTEKSHCRTLRLMQKIFAAGMMKECHLSQATVDRVFPRLQELLDLHIRFLHSLLARQKLRPDRSIDAVGDILLQQFGSIEGERMKVAYGEFCSRHNEAVQLYKDILKSDRKFQAFIKKCSRNSLCKRLGIPECILLVTQRITKYPMLIESIIKATKEKATEREQLWSSLTHTKEILSYVDAQVDAHEKEQKLFEIYNKIDARQTTMFNGNKFKKSDLLSRKLLHEGPIKWMSARAKPQEVLVVILSDLMFFMMENNGKYTFYTQDNKSCVISLSKLLVREKGDTKDSKGLYLICQSNGPEMYELVCRSADDRKAWISLIRSAVQKCPEDDEGIPSESEEERKLLEARAAKMRQIIDRLHEKDVVIKENCDEKMKLVLDMQELYCREGETPPTLKSVYKDEDEQELLDPDVLTHEVSCESSRLIALLQHLHSAPGSWLRDSVAPIGGTSLCRSVTSVGEHETGSKETPPLPKRAETFAGFDGKGKAASIKQRYLSGSGDSRESSSPNLAEADSGVSLEAVNTTKSTNLRGHQNVAIVKLDSKQERLQRRMSSSVLQNLLVKQQQATASSGDQPTAPASCAAGTELDRGASAGDASDRSSDTQGSVCDLSTPLAVLPSSREQSHCAAQLLQYVHSLIAITAQQSTEVESLRAMLHDANAKVSLLYDSERQHGGGSGGRGSYHHDRQLEELRNLQEQLRSDRAELEATRRKHHDELDAQREQLNAERVRVEAAREELRAGREELARQKETLQRQMDLFEQQRRPNRRNRDDRSQSPASAGLSSRNLLEASTSVLHKRSASDDLTTTQSSDGVRTDVRNSPAGAAAVEGGYGDSRRKEVKARSQSVSSSSLVRKESVVDHRPPPQPPLHLLSATNEYKMAAIAAATATTPPPPQQLPLKLSSGTTTSLSSQQTPPSRGQRGSSPQQQHVTRVGQPAVGSLVSPVGVSGGVRGAPQQRLMHAKSQPQLNVHGIRPPRGGVSVVMATPVTPLGNVLPMKLAETSGGGVGKQRPKSAGSATSLRYSPGTPPATMTISASSQHSSPHLTSPPPSSHKPDDDDIIFF